MHLKPVPSVARVMGILSVKTISGMPAGTRSRQQKGTCLSSHSATAPGYFDTTTDEQQVLPAEMLFSCRAILDNEFSPAGYNIVINTGAAADQWVMHCHVHLISRYNDKEEKPKGGIRSLIMDRPERVI